MNNFNIDYDTRIYILACGKYEEEEKLTEQVLNSNTFC